MYILIPYQLVIFPTQRNVVVIVPKVTIAWTTVLGRTWSYYLPIISYHSHGNLAIEVFTNEAILEMLTCGSISICQISEEGLTAVADPGSPREGAPTPEEAPPYYLANFFLKTA